MSFSIALCLIGLLAWLLLATAVFWGLGLCRVRSIQPVLAAGIMAALLGAVCVTLCGPWGPALSPAADGNFWAPLLSRLQSDWLSLSLVLTVTVAAAVIVCSPARTRQNAVSVSELGGACGLVLSLQLVACLNDFWWQWGAIVATGWLASFLLTLDTTREERSSSAGACLGWLTAADLLWLSGLLTLALAFDSTLLGDIQDLDAMQGWSVDQMLLGLGAAVFFLISLLIRTALFPFMSWTRNAAHTGRTAAWMILGGIGCGQLLVLRWTPFLTAFSGTRTLMTGFGALAALFLGVIAVWGTSGPRRLLALASLQASLVWLGLVASPFSPETQCRQFGMASLVLLCLLAANLTALSRWQGASGTARKLMIAALLLLCSGVLGQEHILENLRRADWLNLFNPWLLVLTALTGQSLTAWALWRQAGMMNESPAIRAEDAAMPRPLDWRETNPAVLLAGLLCAGVLIPLAPFVAGGPGRGPIGIPLVSLLAMGIGILAARCWPEPRRFPAGQTVRASVGSLQRMARNEFYFPEMFGLLCVAPALVAAQLSRFAEWFIFGQLIQKLPAGILRHIAESASLNDDETTPGQAAWHLVAACACLLAGVAWAQL